MSDTLKRPPPGAVSGIALAVEQFDHPPTGGAELWETSAITYSGRQMTGAQAGVTLGQVKAAISAVEVGVNGPSIGTAVSAGILSGLHAGAKVEFARAELRTPIGSVATGLNFNTSATVTLTSIGGKIAGFGLSIGLTGIKISCPLLEVAFGANEEGDE